MLRSLNGNQLLILSSADGTAMITPLLAALSERFRVPLSTLKLNAKILKSLGLLTYNGTPACLTEAGRLVLEILGDEDYAQR